MLAAYFFQPVYLAAVYAAFLFYLPELSILRRTSLSLAVSLVLTLWLPFVFGLLLGLRQGMYLSVGIGVILLIIFALKSKTRWRAELTSVLSSLRSAPLTTSAAAAVLLSLLWMQYHHCFRPAPDGLYSQGPAWEDQCWHAMLATSFAYGNNLSRLAYPIFPDWPLGYPFLSNVLAGGYLALGLDVSESFFLTSTFATVAFFVTAFSFARGWLKNEIQALLAVLLMLLAGNFGFLNFIRDWWASGGFFSKIQAHDYANDWSLALHYHIVLTAVVLVMRTSLFGMPIAFAVLDILSGRMNGGTVNGDKEKGAPRDALFMICGALTGLLPLIHAHSFLVVVLAAVCYAAYARKDLRQWTWFFIPAAALALPQLIWTRRQLAQAATPFIRAEIGWMSGASNIIDYLVYWFWNGGLFLPLIVFALIKAEPVIRRRALPFLLLFPLGQVLVFQPYVYDNIKLFSFFNFAGAMLIVAVAGTFWRDTAGFKALYTVLFILLISSGLLSMTNQMVQPWLVIQRDGINFAEAVRGAVPADAVLLTASELNHPASVLSGRRVFLGYKGWLQQHGIDYGVREVLVRKAYSGDAEALATLKKEGVEYLVLGPPETREFPELPDAAIRAQTEQILTSGPYSLHRLRP